MAWGWIVGSTILSMAYPEILISVAFLLSFFFFFSSYRLRRHKLPLNLPVVGMVPDVFSHISRVHDYAAEFLAAANWTFVFKGPWLSGMDMTITCDPDNVNYVFVTRSSNYPKGEEFAEIFDIFGDSLLNSDGEAWRSQRKMIHSLMSNRRFRSYELKASRDKVEKRLIPLLQGVAEQNKVVDLQDVFLRLTFDTACSLILGVDPGCLADDFPDVPFAKALGDAEEVIFLRHIVPKFWWKALRWLGVGEEKKLAMANRVMDDFATSTIARRKESISKEIRSREDGEDDEEAAADLLTVYMHQPTVREKNALEFDKFIKNNALNLLLAGRDTTAATLTWFFWLLSMHPHAEHEILEELNRHWPAAPDETPNPNTPFDRDGLGKLVYLHAALCECLRLYPPIHAQSREVAKPDVLPSGEKVRPGTLLVFHAYSMGRMEGLWGKDCMEFKPERWITESGDLRHEPAHKFFAFSCGSRICQGKDMAFIHMKTVAAAMLRNFRFEVVEGHVVEPKLSIILHMKNGLMVKVCKRERSAVTRSSGGRSSEEVTRERGDCCSMADWAPVVVGVVLFVLLSPGLVLEAPGTHRAVDFGSMRTNGKAVVLHTLVFFALYSVIIVALRLHIYTG
ncbi:unnamed protein product [Musa acuminata var. zebrina]